MNSLEFERLDQLLSNVILKDGNWLADLTEIRKQADKLQDSGLISTPEWSSLVSRSARIQDNRMLIEDIETNFRDIKTLMEK